MNETPAEHAPLPGIFGRFLAAQNSGSVQGASARVIVADAAPQHAAAVYAQGVGPQPHVSHPLPAFGPKVTAFRAAEVSNPLSAMLMTPGEPTAHSEYLPLPLGGQSGLLTPVNPVISSTPSFVSPPAIFGSPISSSYAPKTRGVPDPPVIASTSFATCVPLSHSLLQKGYSQASMYQGGIRCLGTPGIMVSTIPSAGSPNAPWQPLPLPNSFLAESSESPRQDFHQKSIADFMRVLRVAPSLPGRDVIYRFICRRTSEQARMLKLLINEGIKDMPRLANGTYRCTLCSRLVFFRALQHLRNHFSTHLAVKPYTCIFCGSKLSRRDAMYRHVETCKALAACTTAEFGEEIWKLIKYYSLPFHNKDQSRFE